jgi:hypothetical protein
MTPLLVSLAVQLEPVLGPALGWACGVAAAPGLFTWIGGSIVLLATLGATLATAKRQQQEEAAAESEDRLMLKHKSMRLPSVGGNSSLGSYAALVAAEEPAGSPEAGQLPDVASPEASTLGVGSGDLRGGGVGGVCVGGDMEMIVGERAQLLPNGSQLSHHSKPHGREHLEIELPDIHDRG